MSIILQTNPKEKKARLKQLLSWGYVTQQQANKMYREYLRFFKNQFNDITITNMLKLVVAILVALA